MKSALTIAGFDPLGGAGVQADLKVMHHFGIYGLSVITALTAQDSGGVKNIKPVDGEFVKKQIAVLLNDIKPAATKTGMLYSEAIVDVVARAIKKYSLDNVVIDPVLRSSSGRALAEKSVPQAIRKKLLPLCTVVTPNIYEASVLSGVRIRNRSDMEKAAQRLNEYGAPCVIVTGGHLENIAVDVVYDGTFHYLSGRKIAGEFHGTGCRFSAAITALLAKGHSVPRAAELAKRFMKRSFTKSFGTGGKMKLFAV